MESFAKGLHKASPDIYKALRTSVRQAGNMVRDAARDDTSSVKAAKALRVSAGATSATISASGQFPVLLEGPKPFRHPLFGNKKHWYSQNAKPYLAPAGLKKGPEAQQMIGDAVIAAAKKVFDEASSG
jgi:hypothetical protein